MDALEEHELHSVQTHSRAAGPADRTWLREDLAETGEAASDVAQKEQGVPAAGSDVHGVTQGGRGGSGGGLMPPLTPRRYLRRGGSRSRSPLPHNPDTLACGACSGTTLALRA